MGAAVLAVLDVVDVEALLGATAGDGAATVVAAPDLHAHRGGDVGGGRRGRVEFAHVGGVALGLIADRRRDLDGDTAAVLEAALAIAARRNRDLVRGLLG